MIVTQKGGIFMLQSCSPKTKLPFAAISLRVLLQVCNFSRVFINEKLWA